MPVVCLVVVVLQGKVCLVLVLVVPVPVVVVVPVLLLVAPSPGVPSPTAMSTSVPCCAVHLKTARGLVGEGMEGMMEGLVVV